MPRKPKIPSGRSRRSPSLGANAQSAKKTAVVASSAGLHAVLARPTGSPPASTLASGPAGGALAGAGLTTAIGGASTALVRQRILSTVDPLSAAATSLSLTTSRVSAVSNIFLGMQQVQSTVLQLQDLLSTRTVPTTLIGSLVQPGGGAGAMLQVSFDPTSLGGTGAVVTALTDASGSFTLAVPAGVPLADSASLTFQIHGANAHATVSIAAAQVAANGLVGASILPQTLYALPVSILAALQALQPPPPTSSQPTPLVNPAQMPVVTIGEKDSNLLKFGANNSIDRFPYSVFFRLVEPRASIVSQAFSYQVGNNFSFLPIFLNDQSINLSGTAGARAPSPARRPAPPSPVKAGGRGVVAGPSAPPANPSPEQGVVTYVDRVPIEQPLSVDGFREQIMGLQGDGTFTGDETLPMAGTLGLGYVLDMSQRWTFQGLALGDLVYSLPLAPGEQQQIAIFERTDTAAVTESESLTEEEAQQQSALADTSTNATFNSAFQEAINGMSAFQTQSSSSSWGGSLILISGGGGSSSSSGVSQESLSGQRDTAEQAAQTTHSAAENQAAARRTASRTGMRVATASEAMSITTTTITNHNHTRALTMQYWEVLRLYDVTTAIDGLRLCCLVPLQVVRFMTPGQPLTISDPTTMNSRAAVMTRYGNIVKHIDVLAQALPRRFQYGLTLLQQFASDPTATVDVGGVAEDVVTFAIQGTFLFCEDIYVTAMTDRGTRVGPVRLTNSAPTIPADTFASQDQVMGWLTGQRQPGVAGPLISLSGALALPPSMNRSNVVGFEISRNFRTVTYMLLSPEMAALQEMNTLFGAGSWVQQAIQSTIGQNSGATVRTTITLTPANLESALGGPMVYQFTAGIEELQGQTLTPAPNEQYANDDLGGLILPAEPYPVPAIRLGPVLRYQQLLEVEKMAQHIVRNTVLYSRAIWSSLSADERAIMLEAYTIGVPPGGVQDASQMVPLLNCVENRVLGYFGNSWIMPFTVPDILAQSTFDANANEAGGDVGDIEASLLAYHQASFTPPQSTIALPTRGVLGEGVLGTSPSAEKIDITRFWNWQDSPGDSAPSISPVSLPTDSANAAAGLTAPNSLTQLPSLINNVLTAPTPSTSLLQALGSDAASQQDFSSSLTGASQLAQLQQNAQNNANSARSDALATTKALTSQAMATVGNIVGGMYGNPSAGSTAASAAMGGSSGAATGANKGTTGTGAGQGGPSGGTQSGTGGTSQTGTGQSGTAGTTGQSGTGQSGAGGAPSPAPGPGSTAGGTGSGAGAAAGS
jgi:hypothetical protein